jgi:putative transposase
LESRLENDGRLSTDEALWLGGYQAGAEYRAMKEMFEEFGEAALR